MKAVVNLNTTRPMRSAMLIASIVAFLVYVPFFLFPQTCIVANWIAAGDYVKQMQQYNDNHHIVFDSFNLDTKETAAQKAPGTIILVIGESSSRDYMKVYNSELSLMMIHHGKEICVQTIKILYSLTTPIPLMYKQYQL